MSSGNSASSHIDMIERLLAEVREAGPERSFDAETARSLMLLRAINGGISRESDLRALLSEHVGLHRILARSRTKWMDEALGSIHRQEHMLPSPEEEFNSATAIQPMTDASRSGKAFIARNADGESAMVYWRSTDIGVDDGNWARLGTDELFEAVHWVETMWSPDDMRKHVKDAATSPATVVPRGD